MRRYTHLLALNTLILVLVLVLVLAGCNNAPPGTSSSAGAPTVESGSTSGRRFVVTYQGPILCGDRDYKTYRAVYTIKDTATGEEYLGIEGIGVSGLRKVGKNGQGEH